jgi:Flp pilus assembly CpaF family ATPase
MPPPALSYGFRVRGKHGLGWFTINPREGELHNVIERTSKRLVAENKSGEKKYFLRRFPELSDEEQLLLRTLVEGFQSSNAAATEKNISRHLKAHCIENLIELDVEQKQYLLRAMQSALTGFGPMDDVLADKAIEEIALIGVGEKKPLWVFHKAHGWIPTNLFFESQQAACNTVNRMSKGMGRRLTFQTPSINAVLPDGSRLHAATSPVAIGGPCFTIRKFAREYFTPLQLIKTNTVSPALAAFLWMALESNTSTLIAGNTGSGKTTLLNALFSFVPRNERIIVVEETPEISLPHRHTVKLAVLKEQNITMQELIMNTMRMRPDRVVVGEVRHREEMQAFIGTLLAGQGKGSYCTFHGQSSEDVVKRALNYGVSPLDLAAVDLIVVQRRWDKIDLEQNKRKEVRHVTEVSELLLEKGGVRTNRIFEFNFKKGRLERSGESERATEKMEMCFSMGRMGLQKEAKRRECFLRSMLHSELSLEEFFERVNRLGNFNTPMD